MAELRGIELPEEIMTVYTQAVGDANEQAVLDYAKNVANGLLQGLRPIKKNVPQIRKRLINHLEHEKKISGKHLILLEYCRPLGFFEDFTPEMIGDHLPGLCSLYGMELVIASLLLDKREQVRAIPEEVIQGGREIEELSDDDRTEFACRSFNFFGPFFEPIVETMSENDEDAEEASGDKPEPSPPKDDSELRQKEMKIASLEKQAKKLREEKKKLKKDADKLQTTRTQLEKIKKEKAQFKEEVAGLKEKLEKSEEEYEALDAAIAATVDESLQSTLHHWIRKPQEIKKESDALKGLGNSDLAKKAEAVILHQEELDRNAGNRRNLMERLEQLSELKEQIDALSIESITPLKELNTVGKDLQKEISRIKKLIGIPPSDQLTRQFRVRIGAAATFDELSDCKRLLDEMQRMEILPGADMKDLFVYCDARVSLMYDKHVPMVSKAAAPVSSLYRLKQHLHDNTPVLWMLDGYNVLFQLPELFNTLDEDGKPTEASRRALSDMMIEMTKTSPKVSVRLYFDGPKYAEYRASDNILVIYSGGEGDHRADDVICRDLEYQCETNPKMPTVLTTDDRDLRQRVEHLGADAIWVNEFYALVRAFDNGTA